jgi:hypothetical protein
MKRLIILFIFAAAAAAAVQALQRRKRRKITYIILDYQFIIFLFRSILST